MRILFLLLACLNSGLAIADGSSFLSDCKVAIDTIDGRPNNGSQVGAGICLGTVQGMRHLNSFYSVTLKKDQLFFCIPEKVSAGQLARVVVSYLEKNSAKLHEHEGLLVLSSFVDAYPCK